MRAPQQFAESSKFSFAVRGVLLPCHGVRSFPGLPGQKKMMMTVIMMTFKLRPGLQLEVRPFWPEPSGSSKRLRQKAQAAEGRA